MESRLKRIVRVKVLWTKARIPGVHADGEDNLVHGRKAAHVQAEKARGIRRLGGRTPTEQIDDANLHQYGIPIYDSTAGQAQLSELLQRGRGS